MRSAALLAIIALAARRITVARRHLATALGLDGDPACATSWCPCQTDNVCDALSPLKFGVDDEWCRLRPGHTGVHRGPSRLWALADGEAAA